MRGRGKAAAGPRAFVTSADLNELVTVGSFCGRGPRPQKDASAMLRAGITAKDFFEAASSNPVRVAVLHSTAIRCSQLDTQLKLSEAVSQLMTPYCITQFRPQRLCDHLTPASEFSANISARVLGAAATSDRGMSNHLRSRRLRQCRHGLILAPTSLAQGALAGLTSVSAASVPSRRTRPAPHPALNCPVRAASASAAALQVVRQSGPAGSRQRQVAEVAPSM